MASAFQGFDIKFNLSESDDGFDILNNLGGAPIASDISLFLNNLRNASILEVTSAEIQESFIRFNPNVQRFVFTNKTKITIGSSVFFVGDSNTINEFRLYTDEELTDLVTNPEEGTYKRSNAVTSNDITNLVRFRDPVIEDISLSQVGEFDSSQQDIINPYDSFIRVYSRIRSGFSSGISGYINSIESELDVFSQRKENSLNSQLDFNSSNKLSLTGKIYVSDPDGVNNNSVSSVSGPGIFILDPDTDQATRIFSSNENVWTEDGTDLVAASREIVVGNFVFNDGVRILQKNSFPTIAQEQQPITNFTHYVNVTVNGEVYSLCLRL
jgi:hypothetical protein